MRSMAYKVGGRKGMEWSLDRQKVPETDVSMRTSAKCGYMHVDFASKASASRLESVGFGLQA